MTLKIKNKKKKIQIIKINKKDSKHKNRKEKNLVKGNI
jgi:hypothetical protein